MSISIPPKETGRSQVTEAKTNAQTDNLQSSMASNMASFASTQPRKAEQDNFMS